MWDVTGLLDREKEKGQEEGTEWGHVGCVCCCTDIEATVCLNYCLVFDTEMYTSYNIACEKT